MIKVVYDACVLYSAPLRDLLMQLALADIFYARWTDRIHDEWVRNLLANRPDLSPERLARTRRMMNEHVIDSLVEDYESLIETLELPDPDDRHVLAAAIRAEASFIVTFNIADFPASILEKYHIEALAPDNFIALLIKISPVAVLEAVAIRRKELSRPPKSVEEYLATLEKQRLPQTVAFLREHRPEI